MSDESFRPQLLCHRLRHVARRRLRRVDRRETGPPAHGGNRQDLKSARPGNALFYTRSRARAQSVCGGEKIGKSASTLGAEAFARSGELLDPI